MKERSVRARNAVPFGVALLAVCCQSLPMSCAADKSTPQPTNQPNLELLQEKANLDDRPSDKPADAKPELKTLLNGQVTREDASAQVERQGAQVPGTMDLNTAIDTLLGAAHSLDAGDINRLQRTHGITLTIRDNGAGLFDLRPRRPQMSPEEFRKLEYGVIGMESVAHLDGTPPVVAVVFPTCPAANAGIRKGDQVIKANDYVFKPGDGQRVLWQVVGGKAGTPIDITVLREGQLITFHLIRMNIEDIEDVELRQTFENLLSHLGPPTYNQ
jgi:hypothetical protein